jgi:hypothetical protein
VQIPLKKGGKKALRQESQRFQGVVLMSVAQTTPWRFATAVASRRPLC